MMMLSDVIPISFDVGQISQEVVRVADHGVLEALDVVVFAEDGVVLA